MVVVTAVAATVGVAVFGGGSPLPAGSDGGCDPLQVAAAPADAPALRDLADRFARLSRPRQDCRTVEVSTVESAQMAGRLAAGWDPARWGPVPDLWIPESRAWVTRAEAGRGAAALAPAGPSLASSPVVLAMPQPMGDALGWPRRPLSIRQVEQLMTDAKWLGRLRTSGVGSVPLCPAASGDEL